MEKFLLSNFLWSHTPLFGQISLHIQYSQLDSLGVAFYEEKVQSSDGCSIIENAAKPLITQCINTTHY